MAESKNALLQIYGVAILRSILIFTIVIIWLFVFYYSLYEDETVAFLSYVSVALTLNAFWGMKCICEAFWYFLDIISKVLIIAGISLVIFSEFWNTAFYSICLGILIQKGMYDMELQARNFTPDLNAQVTSAAATSDASEEFRQYIARGSLGMRQENKTKEDKSYESVCLDAKIDMQLQSNRDENEQIEILPKEIKNLDKTLNKTNLDVFKIANGHDEIYLKRDFQSTFHDQSNTNGNIIYDKSINKSNSISVEPSKSTLKCSETFQQSEMKSKYVVIDENLKRIASLSTANAQILKLQELSLCELSKLEVDVANIELEGNEETDMDISETSSINLNVKTLNIAFPEDINRLEFTSKTVELFDGPENKVKKEIFNEKTNTDSNGYSDGSRNFIQNTCGYKNLFQQNQNEIEEKQWETAINSESELEEKTKRLLFRMEENISSNVYTDNSNVAEKNDSISFCSYNNSLQENEDEIKRKADLETLHPFKKGNSPLLNKISTYYLDMDLLHRERFEVNSTNSAIDKENGLTNAASMQRNSFEANEKSDSKSEYQSLICNKSVKISHMQHEKEPCPDQLKCTPVKDVNWDVSEKKFKLLPKPEKCLESKGLKSSSKNFDLGIHPLKKNELDEDAEDRNAPKESFKKSFKDVVATSVSCVSNVEEVVNRIDSSFIYALDINNG